uniref:Uncharacterized protein n=1 Tax=Talaromyces marneffei PM1 TaxID=1077442 RepID=A0A093XWG0_TALMA
MPDDAHQIRQTAIVRSDMACPVSGRPGAQQYAMKNSVNVQRKTIVSSYRQVLALHKARKKI